MFSAPPHIHQSSAVSLKRLLHVEDISLIYHHPNLRPMGWMAVQAPPTYWIETNDCREVHISLVRVKDASERGQSQSGQPDLRLSHLLEMVLLCLKGLQLPPEASSLDPHISCWGDFPTTEQTVLKRRPLVVTPPLLVQNVLQLSTAGLCVCVCGLRLETLRATSAASEGGNWVKGEAGSA